MVGSTLPYCATERPVMAVVVWFCAGAAKSSTPHFCDTMPVTSKEKPVSSSMPSVVVGDSERSPDFGST